MFAVSVRHQLYSHNDAFPAKTLKGFLIKTENAIYEYGTQNGDGDDRETADSLTEYHIDEYTLFSANRSIGIYNIYSYLSLMTGWLATSFFILLVFSFVCVLDEAK